MAGNRSAGRDVHIYDVNDPTTVLGGLILTNGITNANLYSMVEVFLLFDGAYILQHEDGTELQRNGQALRRGSYYIVTNGRIVVNNEPWLVRTNSASSGSRFIAFRDSVRDRDRRCVMTREGALAEYGIWFGFEAAHVFPLAYEGHWNDQQFDRWITIVPVSGGSINSVQNGLLLRADIHSLFENYAISINPDDGYKIVCFLPDTKGIAGTYLDQQLLGDNRRPVDQLLRWHFRQAVLANMRGAGEPIFENDFPPGSDMMGEIMSGPRASERMEFELFNRFAMH
ncbi:HNH endonuclease-domain-containing protein [Kalaharituber pfeilii]|nr:HNH endonuclease-domain-containing protein [Kalaharituber pfeilii]